MHSSERASLLTKLAIGWLGILTLACGSKSGLGDGGDNAGTGGMLGAGGSSGAGGGVADAGVACTDDAGSALPAVARRCSLDSDCTIAVASRCCGADQAIGEAKSQSGTYATCLALPPGACQGLGCAKFLGYSTDTGKTTPVVGFSDNPLDWVTVHCLNQVCTTDVLAVQDGGQDAPVADAPVDSTAQSCGSGPACGPGQACVLFSGGPLPPCTPPTDAGVCPAGQVITSSCYDPMTGISRLQWCSTPAPSPHCTQLADGCDGTCSCVCPAVGGVGCFVNSGYVTCGMP